MLNTFTLLLRSLATSIHFPVGWIAKLQGPSLPEDVRCTRDSAPESASHFVNDEEFDHGMMKMLANYNYEGLAAVDNRSYQSGASEIKLYVSVMKALQETGAEMTLVDYVPCWRTPAGTGEGMGFMYWSDQQSIPQRGIHLTDRQQRGIR